jgi:predicted RNA-binding protein (virulence factor B family)
MRNYAGDRFTLEVLREMPPYGFFLELEEGLDVLLPYAERFGELTVGDLVDVFIFHDDKNRLTATMRKTIATTGEVALLEVVDANSRLGLFLDIGIGRNVLLPNSELPEKPEFAPQVGDKVFAYLCHDKSGRMLARLARDLELLPLVYDAPQSWVNTTVNCYVYRPMPFGTFVICEPNGVLGFGAIGMIHESQRPRALRIGELVEARVSFIREDGRVNLTMRERKEIGRVTDADTILAALQERPNGSMPYSDSSPADVILKRFNMSKSAFKRAMGKLMKDGLVRQEGNWTYYIKPEENTPSEE